MVQRPTSRRSPGAGATINLDAQLSMTLPSGTRIGVYDASPDAQRFLVISAPTQPAATTAPRRFVVVQNWHEELKRALPAQ
jgi:hypothetical protein